MKTKNKYAMVTRCDSNAAQLAEVTHCILKDYANQWGCDFIVLDELEDWMTDYELAHYRIFKVREILEKYERVVIIDSDIVIMPGTPNPFDVVPEGMIGSVYEDVGSREDQRQNVIHDIQIKFGDVDWYEGYINTGFFVVSRVHKDIFRKINNELWTGFGYDDAHIGWNIHDQCFAVFGLPYVWNHMSMFSEPWNYSANRFKSYIIHYAGAAAFPDDLSGRGPVGDNGLEGRIALIKSDIDRIANGLMSFTDAKLTSKQGYGSTVLDAKIGVQEEPVIIKVPNGQLRLVRELHTYNMQIPFTVTFLGMGEDNDLGKFLILEKLFDLPEQIDRDYMLEIAVRSLIAARQLYKHKIPWICKLDHIMINKGGQPVLIDFNDDDWDRELQFYSGNDWEAIIMDGKCDDNGVYLGRNTTPWSGWVACMTYLCEKNSIDVEAILAVAERMLWEYEYQRLENVHQPIYVNGYQETLRRETEKNDPCYGTLVPANRECTDRAVMMQGATQGMERHGTWLDIGSNVGWFPLYFADKFRTVGLESDKDMVEFAIMQAEFIGSRARFINKDLTLESAHDLVEYDIISALSVIHWSLVKPPEGSSQTSIGNGKEHFLDLLRVLSDKTRKVFFLEFPPYLYHALGVINLDGLMNLVCETGNFASVVNLGSSDARRPMLKCQK